MPPWKACLHPPSVSPPTPGQMTQWTNQVFANNNWNGLAQRNKPGNSKAAPLAVPLKTGDPSTIKHVFMIVKENRTFDQVLGDLGRGNGDPSLTLFDRNSAPNTHALAQHGIRVDPNGARMIREGAKPRAVAE